jgi:CelD/BcsL family acetyltransferase involved in cellulose biosynthesis
VRACIQSISSPQELDALRDEWQSLLTRCPSYSQCQTHVYSGLAMERALAYGEKVKLICARDSTGLVGLWALSLRREGVFRVLRPMSCGNDQECNVPLVAGDVEAEALEAIVAAALSVACDRTILKQVRRETTLARLLEQTPYSALTSRRINQTSYGVELRRYFTWQDYLGQRSKKNYQRRQRRQRRLSEQGEVELGWCRTAADAEAVLNWIFDTKGRWARKGRKDAPWLDSPRVRDFWIELTKRIDLTNLPLVAFLKLNGRPISGAVHLIGSSSVKGFVTTYDETFSYFSPGEQLIELLSKWCVENHRDFDLGINRADYKERIADREQLVSSYAFDLSPTARLLSRPLFKVGHAVWRSPRKAASLFRKNGWRELASAGGADKI